MTGDAIYTAVWKQDRNNNGIADDEETKYTVTYTDGVDDEVVFDDQITTDLLAGDDTPQFNGTPSRDGYVFRGWNPEVSDKVTGDAIYTAVWEKNPNNDPVDPIDPTPTDPKDPVDPIDPTPMDPKDPVDPIDPTPMDPKDPVDPIDPTPIDPKDPVDPIDPTPTDPADANNITPTEDGKSKADKVETGDNSDIILWSELACLSMVGVYFINLKKKRLNK